MALNKVQIIGRVGKDPEIRKLNSGKSVATLSVATSESYKDKNSGEKKEQTEWHNVVIFAEHTAGFVEQYVNKGDLVYVEGKLQTRKWQDQSGNDRYTTEIVVQPYGGKLDLLSSKDSGGSKRSSRDDDDFGSSKSSKGSLQQDLDDDIPF